MQYSKQFYTNVILFVLSLIVLGLSIWAFVAPCKKDKFGGEILSEEDCDDEEDIEIMAEKAMAVKNRCTECTFLKRELQEKKISGEFAIDSPKPLLSEAISLEEALNLKLRDLFIKMKGLRVEGLYSTVLQAVEKLLITLTLDKTQGNQAKASKILGINRNTLRKKIASLEISIEK